MRGPRLGLNALVFTAPRRLSVDWEVDGGVERGTMARETEVGPASELTPGTLRGAGRYAAGNARGDLFAVTRRCRHLGADLANGSIDRQGCLVCPWHGARYDVTTGRMTGGPQGFFAKIPGVDAGYRLLTRVMPLRRGEIVDRDGTVFVR